MRRVHVRVALSGAIGNPKSNEALNLTKLVQVEVEWAAV
jgi:hypothetical protein